MSDDELEQVYDGNADEFIVLGGCIYLPRQRTEVESDRGDEKGEQT